MTSALTIGWVLRASTVGFTVGCRVLQPDAPQFGDLVKVPLPDDTTNIFGLIGLIDEHPKLTKFNHGEKLEYWAVVWGTAIMIITGFVLWNPIVAAQLLPGQFIPAAKAAHGGEALLAVLSIITWHIYHVHIKHFNKSMFTGRLSRHAMAEEHPLELADIQAGQQAGPIAPTVLRRRRRIFMPFAVLISALLLGGLYIFVTFEQTAITTVPRQEIEIFVPATATPTE